MTTCSDLEEILCLNKSTGRCPTLVFLEKRFTLLFHYKKKAHYIVQFVAFKLNSSKWKGKAVQTLLQGLKGRLHTS
jgi:hypothetical protein